MIRHSPMDRPRGPGTAGDLGGELYPGRVLAPRSMMGRVTGCGRKLRSTPTEHSRPISDRVGWPV